VVAELSTFDQEDQDIEDKLNLDPFDFTGRSFDQPHHTDNINWRELYDWGPELKEIAVEGRDKPVFVGRKSDVAQAVLHHMGRPLRLDNHAFLLPIYNNDDPRILLRCGRQVAKSSTICNIQVIESVIHAHMRSLYVSPSALQTRQYSSEKLHPALDESPFIKRFFRGKGVTDHVFEKTLLNGSYLFLRYAFLTAARARGIPASRVFFDEVQDLLKENIKIISQSLSASRLAAGLKGQELLAGTPLTFSNTLEEYWRWSTQNEWLVPCECVSPHYWNLLGTKNIGKKGLVCANCDKPIDPTTGQWVSFVPDEYYSGYHITQLMVPWKQNEEDWHDDIVIPFERWPEAKFHNEVLGLPYDNASAPISLLHIQQNCWPTKQVSNLDTRDFHYQRGHMHSGIRIFAGIDWGEGREEGEVDKGRKKFASWTVLTIGGYANADLFWALQMKRYVGKDVDPELILPDVLHLCDYWNVEVIGADWGHGWGMNSRLMHARGRERVMQFAYSTSLGERKRWDGGAYKYMINRNAVISDFFSELKKAHFLLPEYKTFEPFAKDILAEYVEYNERIRTMTYDHPIDLPDDALHSMIYCKLAADISMGLF
jgi:Phage terminase large subunit (GpA)